MKIEKLVLKHQGKPVTGSIALPESLTEAVQVLTDREVYRLFLKAFRAEAMQGIKGRKPRRKRFVKVDLESVPLELRQYLLNQGSASKKSEKHTPVEVAEENPQAGEP